MTCGVKHTKYQPTDKEWRCPKCGASADKGFCINEPAEGTDDNCSLLHDEDGIGCDNCMTEHDRNTYYSGKQFAALLVKKNNLVPCPHCKGTGLVKKKGG